MEPTLTPHCTPAHRYRWQDHLRAVGGALFLVILVGCQSPEPPILIENRTPERPVQPRETVDPATIEGDRENPIQTMPSIRTTVLPASDLEDVSSATNLFKRYESQRGYALIHPRDWFVADIKGETFVSQAPLPDPDELSQTGGRFVKISARLRPQQLEHITLHLDILRQWEAQTAIDIIDSDPPQQQTHSRLESIRTETVLEIDNQPFELIVVTYQTEKNFVSLAGMQPITSSGEERSLLESVIGSLEIDATRLVPIETFKREPVAKAVEIDGLPTQPIDLSDVEGVLSPLETTTGVVSEFEVSSWRIIGRAGEVYLVDVVATTNRFDPIYDLLDPNGRSILPQPLIPGQLTNQANESPRLLIPADGNYTLVIRGANYSGGLYEVTLRKESGTIPAEAQAIGLFYNQTVTGTIAATQTPVWMTVAHPNRPLNIDLEAPTEALSLSIEDLDGNVLQTTAIDTPQIRFFTVRRSQFIKIVMLDEREAADISDPIPYKLTLTPAFENQNVTLIEFQSDDVFNLPINVSTQTESQLLIGVNRPPNPLEITIRAERDAEPLFQSNTALSWTESDYRFATPGRYRLKLAPQIDDVALTALSSKGIDGYVIGEAGLQFSLQENQRIKLGFFGNENRTLALSAPYIDLNQQGNTGDKQLRFVAQPENREMDITLALISESGQVILNKDEGFGGVAEEIILDGSTGSAFSGKIVVRALPGHFGFVDILVDVQSP